MVDQQLDDDEYFIHFKDDVLENEFTKEVSFRVTADAPKCFWLSFRSRCKFQSIS